MRVDIMIVGNGFYQIEAVTSNGADWMIENIPSSEITRGIVFAYSDDTRMTQDIAGGATDDGLSVMVNSQIYSEATA